MKFILHLLIAASFATQDISRADSETNWAERLKKTENWYRSACPASGPSESRAAIAVKIISETDRSLQEIRTESSDLQKFIINPNTEIDRQIALRLKTLREKVAELRDDKSAGAAERLTLAQAELTRNESALGSKKQREEYTQKKVTAATTRLKTLTDQSDAFQKIQQQSQDCYAVAANAGRLAETVEAEERSQNAAPQSSQPGSTSNPPSQSELGIQPSPNAPGSNPNLSPQTPTPRKAEDFNLQYQ